MNIVILAAGQGQRMRSALPKVMQLLAGKPMLQYVLETALTVSPKTKPIVVIGHGAPLVSQYIAHFAKQNTTTFKLSTNISTVKQAQQKGTGHALLQALPKLNLAEPTLVLYGDVPLISSATLKRLIKLADGVAKQDSALALLTQEMVDPKGYGRIVRNTAGEVVAIIEEKDASPQQQAIQEINTGIMVLPSQHLKRWLKALRVSNAQGEYYLTDVFAMSVKDGVPIRTTQANNAWETIGVNDRAQLAALERIAQQEIASNLLSNGVSLADPARLDVRGKLICGQDVFIDIGCLFEGEVSLAAGVRVGPNCVLRNTQVGMRVEIQAFSHLDGATIGDDCIIGPYARLRPGANLANDVHIGNFVEVKNSQLGSHSKVNHLAYVGDAVVGKRVNIGAGTITCNYDGVNKHQTIIEDDVFIGSDTQLVAPVRVGRGATLGAGTTLTKDAPANQLTISRAKQVSVPWQRPEKKVLVKKKLSSKGKK